MTTSSAEPGAREEALVKIACIQMEPVIGGREENNQVLRNRRVDVYGEMLGAQAARGGY